MKPEEIITINKRLTWMRDDIRMKITQLEPICDGTGIDRASDAIFGVILIWIENNVEDIEFKSMPKVETAACTDKQG